jgi:hypothetical protein
MDPNQTSALETTAAFWNRMVCKRRIARYRPSGQPKRELGMCGGDMQTMTIAHSFT